MQTASPIGKNVIVKIETKKSILKLPEGHKDGMTIENTTAFKVGDEVTKIKEGQEIVLPTSILVDASRIFMPFRPTKKEENIYYMLVNEDEIKAVF